MAFVKRQCDITTVGVLSSIDNVHVLNLHFWFNYSVVLFI